MSAQLDMFGGSEPVKPASSDPYTPPAYGYKTCWVDCSHCGTWLSSQKHKNPKKRIFTVCLHPDKDRPKVYEDDAICTLAKCVSAPAPIKPASPDWADY